MMKISPEKGSEKPCLNCACQYSLRHILLLFVFLLVLVVINFLASTSKLSLVVDVSMRMKSDVLDAFKGLTDFNRDRDMNKTFSLRIYDDLTQHGAKDQVINEDGESFRTRERNPIYNSYETEKEDSGVLNDSSLNISGTKLRMKSGRFNDRNILSEDKFKSDPSLSNSNDSTIHIPRLSNIKQKDKALVTDWRKDTCDMCFEHHFNYVIDNPDICKLSSPSHQIDIVIVILTEHKNYRARSAIRETWLSPYLNNTGNIRYVFLLGEVQDLNQRELVQEENDVYHDIIKEDFIDSYMNLTYKTIMGFKWASTKCNQARFVFKTDDDMFVNVNNLLNAVNKQGSALQTAVMGSCNMKAKPIRNKKSKWYASYTTYPNSQYPGFCSGTGYVTSMNVVKQVYEISPKIPFFHLEDVYIALCVRKLGFTLMPTSGFLASRRRLDPCGFRGNKAITVHQLSPLMLRMIWRRSCNPHLFISKEAAPILSKKGSRMPKRFLGV